ncbi:MAG: hypothetical protein OXF93_00870 [Acidobacteria bacterium]|nr:hypothetical protein [Acidobacteriota bacterium]
MRVLTVSSALLVAVCAGPALADEAADLLRADVKAGRLATMMQQGDGRSVLDPAIQQLHANNPYRIGIGVFGAYNPSIFPNETWIDVACFGQPGRSYPHGFSLMYVDVSLYRNGNRVWSSTSSGNDRGICDISRGVDTTFIEIPRGFRFDTWTVFVTSAERHRRGVATGGRVYRREPLPSWCDDDRWDCADPTVRYVNPKHIYR